jgi:hypothetical protein
VYQYAILYCKATSRKLPQHVTNSTVKLIDASTHIYLLCKWRMPKCVVIQEVTGSHWECVSLIFVVTDTIAYVLSLLWWQLSRSLLQLTVQLRDADVTVDNQALNMCIQQ